VNFNLGELLIKHFNGQTSEAEERILAEWLSRSEENRKFYDSFSDKENIRQRLALFNSIQQSAGWQKIEGSIESLKREELTVTPASSPIRRFGSRLIRYAAAIAILLGCAVYFYWNPVVKGKDALKTTSSETELLPGGDRATLTLANGTTIDLDSLANGQLVTEGSAKIIKLSNGQLSYLAKPDVPSSSSAVAYNTLKTPKGGQYQIILPDGTRVWLNATSSVTYPTAFLEKERVVEIAGEVYFEVMKNPKRPFKVKTDRGTVIEVLGTYFNVNAYADEKSDKTSLLEGAIKIEGKLLAPGQAYTNGKVIATDTDQDIAWKNGVFNFHNVKLPEAMRQIARWYDVDIRYDEKAAEIEFGGKMGRNLTLEQVLKGLEGIDDMRFKLEGRTLFVIL